MKNKLLESKKELISVLVTATLAFGGLPILIHYFPSSVLVSIYAVVVLFAFAALTNILFLKLIKEQPVERAMKYEEKVKNYRINQVRMMIPFVLTSLSFVAILYVITVLNPTAIPRIIMSASFVAIGVFLIKEGTTFVKALLKFIKGSD